MYPRVWEGFTELYLKLDRALADTWWRALCQSRWSRARELRQLVSGFNLQNRAMPEDVERFWHTHLAPQTLVAVLEDLVKERQLSRRKATSIEETICTMLRPDGAWK